MSDLSKLPYKQASILVTGGLGFIGSALVQNLARLLPVRLVVLGRDSASAKVLSCEVEYRQLDLTTATGADLHWLKDAFDYVFHCAGVIDQSNTPGIYQRQIAAHLDVTLRLLESTRGDRLKRFIQLGSNAEYGTAPTPQSANGLCRPNSAYGVSKLAASSAVIAHALADKVPAIVVRPFLVYGRGMADKSLLAMALKAAREKMEFATTLGEQTRDFVPVEKVVADLLVAARDPFLVGQIVNSCSGVERTIRTVLAELAELAPGFMPLFGKVPYRDTELMRSVGVPYAPMSPPDAEASLRAFFIDQLSR
jgi:nucleoside-diphosphate-sugar epimerase